MADQINMGGLSLNDGVQQGPAQGQRSYIPPHMRRQGGPPQGGPPAMNGGPSPAGPGPNGLGNSAWAK
jgi:ATP-dependent RNA helicase DDX3X